jgi:hypothetical protein
VSAIEDSLVPDGGEPAPGRPAAPEQPDEGFASAAIAREKARYLWVTFPRAWLKASMSPRRRIDGIAVVPPGEIRKPFSYARNPYPHFHIPGRRQQFGVKRQSQLAEAHGAIQTDWQAATARATGAGGTSASADLFSVPAIAVYTSRLRDTAKTTLLNLYLFRSPAPAGGYGDDGWIARGLLVTRTLPVYWRRHADGTPYAFRDPRKVDAALAQLARLGILEYSLIERPEGSVYEFRFIDGWQDRLGAMPLMPHAQKVRPWIARRAHLAGPASAPTLRADEFNNPSNGHHNPQN